MSKLHSFKSLWDIRRLALVGLAVLGLLLVGCDQATEITSVPQEETSLELSLTSQIQAVMVIQDRHTDRLLSISGALGTATGLTEDGRPAILVFIETEALAKSAGIAATIEEVPVIVKVTGEIQALSHATERFDQPVPIGVSTGHPDITAGTIACRVKDKDGPNVYALSNNHVYAAENDASIGDNILQPGPFDGGIDPEDASGTLSDFEPIVFGRRFKNEIDAAIALSSTANLGTATPVGGYGTPNSTIVGAVLDQQVQKFGRTTELTKGKITGVNATVNVRYSSGIAKFVKQIIVESETRFIGAGDSGSLLVTDNADLNPVGLLFAGNSDGTFAIANRIDLVLDRFGVIVDGEAPPPPTNGLIGGTVTNASGGAAIAGVTISLDTGQSTTTAGDGSYTITDVPTGDRSVTASKGGFESQTKTATVNKSQTTIIDFALNEAPAAPTLSVSVTTKKTSYVNKEQVEITVTVADETNPVGGAAVHVEITTGNKKFRLLFDGNTNGVGVATFKYKVNSKRDGEGIYKVDATASKDGFESGSESTTFAVTD